MNQHESHKGLNVAPEHPPLADIAPFRGTLENNDTAIFVWPFHHKAHLRSWKKKSLQGISVTYFSLAAAIALSDSIQKVFSLTTPPSYSKKHIDPLEYSNSVGVENILHILNKALSDIAEVLICSFPNKSSIFEVFYLKIG